LRSSLGITTGQRLHSAAMLRWRPWAIVLAALLALMAAYATGVDFRVSVGNWRNGDTIDSMWNFPILDVPGASIIDVNCRGRGVLEVQVGATGDPNPCYTFGSRIPTGSLMWYMRLPGNKVIWRCTSNEGPWRYFVADAYGPQAPSNQSPPYVCR
jgi:hypothetical protein